VSTGTGILHPSVAEKWSEQRYFSFEEGSKMQRTQNLVGEG
jgi:hypothetical protein